LLRRVALVRTDVSEEPGASFIRVTKLGALGTTQAATSNRVRRENLKSYAVNIVLRSLILSILMMEAILSSETWVLIKATRRHIPADGTLHAKMLSTEVHRQSSKVVSLPTASIMRHAVAQCLRHYATSRRSRIRDLMT
jgi:hypothetical protein